MPARELSRPEQVVDWLAAWGNELCHEGEMILIGSGGLLWHVHKAGRNDPLPESSMDVDPITFDEEVAALAYDSLIGSKFEQQHGWHVNLMPDMALDFFPQGWRGRSSNACYGKLTVIIPSVADLLAPKLKRNEPRDVLHAKFMAELGLYQTEK